MVYLHYTTLFFCGRIRKNIGNKSTSCGIEHCGHIHKAPEGNPELGHRITITHVKDCGGRLHIHLCISLRNLFSNNRIKTIVFYLR